MIKRSTVIASVVFVAASTGALLAPGCSTKTNENAPPPSGLIKPPAAPTVTAAGTTRWFAIDSMRLGTTEKGTWTPKPDAWKNYGYDLDNRITTEDDSVNNINTCKRVDKAAPKALVDGNGGIDNNFGQHVMPLLKLSGDVESTVITNIRDGKFSLILKIDNFTSADNASAPGQLFVAADFADGTAVPTFTDKDVWNVNATSLKDGKTVAAGAKVNFPKAYVAQGFWVSGPLGSDDIAVSISFGGADILLPISSGVLTFAVDGTSGTIAGAMASEKLEAAMIPVAEKLGFCPGSPLYDTLLAVLRRSADLVSGAKDLQDTTRTCNAVSIALGFSAKPTGDHTAAKVITPPANPASTCGDAGPDAADADADTAGGG